MLFSILSVTTSTKRKECYHPTHDTFAPRPSGKPRQGDLPPTRTMFKVTTGWTIFKSESATVLPNGFNMWSVQLELQEEIMDPASIMDAVISHLKVHVLLLTTFLSLSFFLGRSAPPPHCIHAKLNTSNT